jgi:hypothetical protein
MNDKRRRERAKRKRRGGRRLGSVVIFALTVLTPILAASGTVLSQLRSYAEEVDHRFHSVTAQLVAASGAHEALALLAADGGWRGTFVLQVNGGRTAVEVTQIEGDLTLDVTDDRILVRSEGWLNGPTEAGGAPRDGVRWFRSVVNATVKPRLVRVPITQSAFIGDSTPQVYVSGTAFRIAGEDSAADPEDSLPGLGVTGNPTIVANQIPMMLQQYVTGSDAPTIASVHKSMPVDLPTWMERFHVDPTILWTAPTERLDNATLGNESNPTVAFAEGDLVVRGNVSGRGALVVQGDLLVTGSLDFAGIILVGGTATFNGTTGTTTHRGALLVGGAPTGRDLQVIGNVQLRYDSSALEQLVGEFVDGVEVVTWEHDLDAALNDDGSSTP